MCWHDLAFCGCWIISPHLCHVLSGSYQSEEDLIKSFSRPLTRPRLVKNVCPGPQIALAVFKVKSTGTSNLSLTGECDILEDNLVEVISNVESVEMCKDHCAVSSACNFFTYLGEENHLRYQFIFSMQLIQVLHKWLIDCTFSILYTILVQKQFLQSILKDFSEKYALCTACKICRVYKITKIIILAWKPKQKIHFRFDNACNEWNWSFHFHRHMCFLFSSCEVSIIHSCCWFQNSLSNRDVTKR